MAVDYRGDYVIRFGFPHKINGDGSLVAADLLTVANGAACSYAAYSTPIRSTILTVPNTISITVSLDDIGLFAIGQRIELIDGLSAAQVVTLDGLDTGTGTLDFSGDAIANAPIIGSPLRLIHGPNGSERQTMAEYGEAVPPVDAATKLWGWEAGFTNTLYPDITPRMSFEIESRVIGAGGNLDGVRREFHVMRDTRQVP